MLALFPACNHSLRVLTILRWQTVLGGRGGFTQVKTGADTALCVKRSAPHPPPKKKERGRETRWSCCCCSLLMHSASADSILSASFSASLRARTVSVSERRADKVSQHHPSELIHVFRQRAQHGPGRSVWSNIRSESHRGRLLILTPRGEASAGAKKGWRREVNADERHYWHLQCTAHPCAKRTPSIQLHAGAALSADACLLGSVFHPVFSLFLLLAREGNPSVLLETRTST